jgi:hypothetical protein
MEIRGLKLKTQNQTNQWVTKRSGLATTAREHLPIERAGWCTHQGLDHPSDTCPYACDASPRVFLLLGLNL